MDLNSEQTYIIEDNKEIVQRNTKRKCEDEDDRQDSNKKPRNHQSTPATSVEHKTICQKAVTERPTMAEPQITREHIKPDSEEHNKVPSTSGIHITKSPERKLLNSKVPQSPKKRLDINFDSNKQNNKQRFIYGNYSQYYGYRNNNSINKSKEKGFHDIRLDVFHEHKEMFREKHALDIGCNTGFITIEVAKKLEVKSIVGLDIDRQLINQAVKSLVKYKKALPMDNELKRRHKFPFNATFVHGNYVLKDEVLLEIEKPQFDIILCLSITKWIQLNFGDAGLKLTFKRMFLQLKPKGILILEAQPYDNYGRRKKMTDTIFENYKNMKFFPKDFATYLLSSEVGFSKMDLMGVPDHCKKGFKRPIHIFYKE